MSFSFAIPQFNELDAGAGESHYANFPQFRTPKRGHAESAGSDALSQGRIVSSALQIAFLVNFEAKRVPVHVITFSSLEQITVPAPIVNWTAKR